MARRKRVAKPPVGPLGAAALRRLFAHLPSAVVYSVDERMVWANAAAVSLLGRPVADLVGRPFSDIVAAADLPTIRARYWARQRGQQAPPVYEVSLVRADGTLVRVEVEPRAMGERQLLVVARDVSNRVRDAKLLAALSGLAAKVQQARTEAEVLSTTADGLVALGLNSLVLKLDGDRIGVAQMALKGDGAEVLGRLMGVLRRSPRCRCRASRPRCGC